MPKSLGPAVLIVGDNTIELERLKEVAETENLTPIVASAEVALDHPRLRACILIIADFANGPDLAIQFIRDIRSKYLETPAIVLGDAFTQETRNAVGLLGKARCRIKPFFPATLDKLVSELAPSVIRIPRPLPQKPAKPPPPKQSAPSAISPKLPTPQKQPSASKQPPPLKELPREKEEFVTVAGYPDLIPLGQPSQRAFFGEYTLETRAYRSKTSSEALTYWQVYKRDNSPLPTGVPIELFRKRNLALIRIDHWRNVSKRTASQTSSEEAPRAAEPHLVAFGTPLDINPDHVPPAELLTVLKTHFGFDSFRPGQSEVVEQLLAGGQGLAVMPTGGGKSLLYELPTRLMEGLTVVVSPLISLMKDQESRLHARGFTDALLINSSLSSEKVRERAELVSSGKVKLLYVAPERFASSSFAQMLTNQTIGLFAVDEAHCISQWGHAFRPEYLALEAAIRSLKPKSVLAVTATATPRVRNEILERLALENPFVYVAPLDRPNLQFSVDRCEGSARKKQLCKVVKSIPGSQIVYTAKRKDAEDIADDLAKQGVSVQYYHAGLAPDHRTKAQEAWRAGKVQVIVSTVAFGMGIDKPDVRAVIHEHFPKSLEQYYQEAGRAGRDGKSAVCKILYSGDSSFNNWCIDSEYPDRKGIVSVFRSITLGKTPDPDDPRTKAAVMALMEAGYLEERTRRLPVIRQGAPPIEDLNLDWFYAREKAARKRLAIVRDYCERNTCRVAQLLRYFGESPRSETCSHCDVCCCESNQAESRNPDWLSHFISGTG